MKLIVQKIIKETQDAVTISFKNGGLFKKVKYKPGQFLTLHFSIKGATHKRAYSFSSNPYLDKDLRVTIKRVEKGLVSNYVHDGLKVGDALEIDKPSGSFYIEPQKNQQKQYVLFAGGSGITPIFSIINSVLTKEPNSKILLVYANQNFDAIIFKKEIELLEESYPDKLAVAHILTTNNQVDAKYYSGLATNEIITTILKKYNLSFDNHVYMICGPFGYMESIKAILNENGVERNQIKVELFKSPKVKITGKDLISKVEIKHDGASHKIEIPGNKSILQGAMSNNVVLPYSCRSGMCASCKATCISGDIKMTEGHFLEQKEVDEGKILTCISYPESEHVVIAY